MGREERERERGKFFWRDGEKVGAELWKKGVEDAAKERRIRKLKEKVEMAEE